MLVLGCIARPVRGRHQTPPRGSFELRSQALKHKHTSPKTKPTPGDRRQRAWAPGSLGDTPTHALQWAASCWSHLILPWVTFSPHFLSSSEKYPRVNRRKQKHWKASAEHQGWNRSPEAPPCGHTRSTATATTPRSLGPRYGTDRSDSPPRSGKLVTYPTAGSSLRPSGSQGPQGLQ